MLESTQRRGFRPRLLRLEDRLAPSFGPIGPEFQVNTYTTNDQSFGFVAADAVASDADGDFVIVWMSNGQDGASLGVYAQRHSSDGTPLGGEFRVNTFTADTEANPAVAMNAAGDFIVAWTSDGQNGIYAQRYDSAGLPQGGEFRVNANTTGGHSFPTVAMDLAGNFVVAWSSNRDGSISGIYAQRYSATGEPVGAEFRVNSFTTDSQSEADVAMNAAGDFVIVWQSGTSFGFGQDGSDLGIFGQRYNSAGARQGAEFRVNTYTTGAQMAPQVAMDSAGDFVVAWDSQEDVYAQRYSATGAPLGAEFRVNTHIPARQGYSTVAMDADGDFVVAWNSNSNSQDGSSWGVYAQRYSALGVSLGDEFRVNTYTTSVQLFPTVAMDANGDFVVVWESLGQDGDGRGVFAQPYHANRPPTTSGLPNTTIPLAPPTSIDLSASFADADDGLAGLTFSVTDNTNPALFTSTSITGSTLTLAPAGANGSATLTVSATDLDGDFIETSFSVTVGTVTPTVSGTQVNGGAPQRSRVTSLTVIFNSQVTFAGTVASAFTLTRNGGGAVNFTATAIVGSATVVTLNAFTGPETQSGSLRDGRYTLTALASQISANGQQMASNFTFGDAQGLYRYYGDMNGDRRVDISDFGFFSLAYLQSPNYNAALDFNNDGRIDIADFGQFSVRFFTTLP